MALPRIHAFEINDHPAAPEALKETIIEALSRTLDWGKMLDGLVPELERFWTEAGVTELLDLGAGAGGRRVLRGPGLCDQPHPQRRSGRRELQNE